MLVPTMPRFYTVAEVEADPVRLNSRLGTYTNFVNLLDLCAIAVPAGVRGDGLPSSVTLIAPSGADGLIAGLAATVHARAGGPAKAAASARPRAGADAQAERIEIAVLGAHLTGLPLNRELVDLGAIVFARSRDVARLSSVCATRFGSSQTGTAQGRRRRRLRDQGRGLDARPRRLRRFCGPNPRPARHRDNPAQGRRVGERISGRGRGGQGGGGCFGLRRLARLPRLPLTIADVAAAHVGAVCRSAIARRARAMNARAVRVSAGRDRTPARRATGRETRPLHARRKLRPSRPSPARRRPPCPEGADRSPSSRSRSAV